MLARIVAAWLVLVLVGPSVVSATCELTCALGSHHHSAPESTEAPCHEHQGANQGVGVHADPSALCHESGAFPSAVVDLWLNSVAVSALPAVSVVLAPPVATRTIARAPERSAPFDPRPAHTPLRV